MHHMQQQGQDWNTTFWHLTRILIVRPISKIASRNFVDWESMNKSTKFSGKKIKAAHGSNNDTVWTSKPV